MSKILRYIFKMIHNPEINGRIPNNYEKEKKIVEKEKLIGHVRMIPKLLFVDGVVINFIMLQSLYQQLHRLRFTLIFF